MYRIINTAPARMTVVVFIFSFLSGCATWPVAEDVPNVRVAGLEPLPAEGLEIRLALKLRVQNPNDSALAYNGISVQLKLDGQGLASGVSNASGEIARFSEEVLTIPVSISAFSVVRQIFSRSADTTESTVNQSIAYSLTGKMGAVAGKSGTTRFSDEGELNLFSNTSDSE